MALLRRTASAAVTCEAAVDSNATRLYTWKARHLKYATWPEAALVNFAFMHPSGERVERWVHNAER